MMNRKVWPSLLLIVLFGVFFWAFRGSNDGQNSSEDKYAQQQKLLSAIGMILEEKHFSPRPINDSFSNAVFNKYLESLDPDKDLFTQADMQTLSKYQNSIDDEINGDVAMQFYPAAGEIYKKRLDDAMNIYQEILSKPFDFNLNETAQVDGDQLQYAADDAALKENWRKRLKFMTLERFTDLQQQREKADKKDTSVNKTDAELEAVARKRVLDLMNRNFNRQKLVFTSDEQFSTFVNTVTTLMDPHTEYFAPVDKRGFDEEMSGRFYGIGAQLKEEDGAVKIASLITGSPAWKSGQVQVNDVVIKVAQGNAEPVDVEGYGVTDVVKLIRGTKGTEVKITFKKPDGTTKVVSIIRDEIVQDETFARSSVITNNGKKIGYIFLPEFYADFDRADGNRCSQDVANEIKKLKNENVEGIILDLRNNGGGSLYEVVQMVGLFIKTGPVVQVKDRDGKPVTLSDTDPSVLYDGPLAVMVNEFSASASEIFAAAIQDYKRGIIVGSSSTYGKGTVQKNIPLGRPIDNTGQPEFGALKLTFEKFYRINGGSTQLKGVTPQVVIPDAYEYLKLREKDNDAALPWDQIPQADYLVAKPNMNWDEVIKRANDRINNNPSFKLLRDNTSWLSSNIDQPYNLNIAEYKKQQKLLNGTVQQDDDLVKLKTPMDVKPIAVDKDKFYNNPDKAKGDRYKAWLKAVQSDLYINETVNIVQDIMNVQNNVTVKQ